MHYTYVLLNFNIEWDTYEELNKQDDFNVPEINDKNNDRKVIKWVSICTYFLSQTYGSRETLVYVLLESNDVSSDIEDPLDANSYHGRKYQAVEQANNC